MLEEPFGGVVKHAQSKLCILMRQVSGWMTVHGFSLVLEKKTEVVILTRKRISALQPTMMGAILDSKEMVKYFGVTFDAKVSFLSKSKQQLIKLHHGFRHRFR